MDGAVRRRKTDRSPHVERDPRFVGHTGLIPRWIKHHVYLRARNTCDCANGILNPSRHFTRDGTSRRGQRHLDADKTTVIYINIVNQA
jgi:hypothetical protein